GGIQPCTLHCAGCRPGWGTAEEIPGRKNICDDPGGEYLQHLWTHRDDNQLDLDGDKTRRGIRPAYWQADREYAGVHPRAKNGTCAGGGYGRNLYCGSRSNPRLSEPSAIDSRTVFKRPVRRKTRGQTVSDRRSRPVAGRWKYRVRGTE